MTWKPYIGDYLPFLLDFRSFIKTSLVLYNPSILIIIYTHSDYGKETISFSWVIFFFLVTQTDGLPGIVKIGKVKNYDLKTAI